MYVLIASKAARTVINHPALSLMLASRSLRDNGFFSDNTTSDMFTP
jgi:hypothetical protein